VFKCSISDFTLLHRPEEGPPGPHFELVVLGAGSERPSEPFFMSYPMLFLEHYYSTFPDEKNMHKQTDHAVGATTATDGDGEADDAAPTNPRSTTSV